MGERIQAHEQRLGLLGRHVEHEDREQLIGGEIASEMPVDQRQLLARLVGDAGIGDPDLLEQRSKRRALRVGMSPPVLWVVQKLASRDPSELDDSVAEQTGNSRDVDCR